MSFPSSSQLPKYYQPQNNLSSPNLYSTYKKSDLTIQLDKSPQQPAGFISHSQRLVTSTNYGQMSNNLYTSGTSRQTTNNGTGTKLNQMSSDLAKLKQQLSKIMNQAEKSEKRPVTNNQSNNALTSQNLASQSFTKPRYVEQTVVNPVNISMNKTQQRNSIATVDPKYLSYERKTQSSKFLSPQKSTNKNKNDLYTDSQSFTQKKPYSVQHSESEKRLDSGVRQVSNYSTSQDSNMVNGQELTQHSEVLNLNGESFLNQTRPKLKIRDEFGVGNGINNVIGCLDERKSGVDTNQTSKKYYGELQTQQMSLAKQQSSQESPKKLQAKTQVMIQPADSLSFPSPITKKSSSNLSHQVIVNRIVNEQLSKKLQQSMQIKSLRKKKQQQEYQYQQKIIELQHQKRKLKHQINSALLEKENTELALKTEKSQREALHRKYRQLEDILKSTKLQLEEAKTKQKILQRKLQSQLSRPRVLTEAPSFDEALKQQISQINKLKQQLQEKDEQIIRIKDTNTTHRREIDSLHNQIKIQQLKAASQLNQCDQKHSITLQDKENQIKTLKNLCVTLEAKLDVAVKQNGTKDAFMVQHLTGKVKLGEEKEYILNFFKNYEVEFPTNRFANKINEELKEIQKLKKTILQMASSMK